MIYKFKIVLLLLFGLLVLQKGNAQEVFYSQQLQNLYYQLPDVCRINTKIAKDTVVLCRDVVQGETVPLVFRWDENKVLEHIGCHFLQSDSIQSNATITRFVERELLLMLLTTDIAQTLITFRENSLSVLLNNTLVTQRFLQNKRQILNFIKHNQGIAMNFDGKQHDVALHSADGQKLLFRFKPDGELLTGMDKKERDVRLAMQLKNHSAKGRTNKVTTPDYSYLRLLHDSIYVDKGNEFMIPQINNDLFYIKEDRIYTLALDTSFIAGSFSNALLAFDVHNYKINITHRMYGNVVKKYTVDSRDFYDYFSRDYDRYFGAESLKKTKPLTGTLILSDRNAGNIHLAFVSITLNDLLHGGTMEVLLYSNIPQQNIKTLFGKQ